MSEEDLTDQTLTDLPLKLVVGHIYLDEYGDRVQIIQRRGGSDFPQYLGDSGHTYHRNGTPDGLSGVGVAYLLDVVGVSPDPPRWVPIKRDSTRDECESTWPSTKEVAEEPKMPKVGDIVHYYDYDYHDPDEYPEKEPTAAIVTATNYASVDLAVFMRDHMIFKVDVKYRANAYEDGFWVWPY